MNRRPLMSGDIRRGRARRQERKTILIVTEGIRTEPDYFRRLSRHLRATGVQVRPHKVIGEGRDPLSVVKEADRIRRERRGDQVFDEAWAVVDVDTHEKLELAIAEAGRLKINLAISNPCFEIWMLWHYEDFSKSANAAQLVRRLEQLGISGKAIPEGFPIEEVPKAEARAASSSPPDVSHAGPNPSTAVHLLVRSVRGVR